MDPDSKHIVYQSSDLGIVMQAADGSDKPKPLIPAKPGEELVPESWSSKADVMLYSVVTGKGSQFSLWKYDLRNDKAEPWGNVQSLAPTGATFSPDGNWVAYTKEVKGRDHNLRPGIPSGHGASTTTPKAPIRPSTCAGRPRERKLFYDPRPGGFESVSVTTQPFEFGNRGHRCAPCSRSVLLAGGPTTTSSQRTAGSSGSSPRVTMIFVRNPMDQMQVTSNVSGWLKQQFPSRSWFEWLKEQFQSR